MNSELMNENKEVYMDEQGNPVTTQYVDEVGNPLDATNINVNDFAGTANDFVDEQGNPVTTNLETLDENNMVTGATTAPISAAVNQIENKELLTGMVTFDYNNVPITDIVNSIILDAINKGASDIHFDPFAEGIKIRIRIDGLLNDYSIVPLFVKKNMITRIKIISGMNITESRMPQDGAIRTELHNKTVDLRVSCLPTSLGEKIVIRIMDYSMSSAGIEALDFSPKNLEKVNKMLSLPNGIILVTGATGTGKSTTVYSMLQKLNVEGTNIVTVEDPIEMNIGGINQVQALPDIGLNFATALRSILRQDPDVIMIGEIRDDETARIAVRASITGHLVLSTIHTNNSLNTIERLTDMSVERYLLGAALEGIVSQKLSRRLCEKCKRLRETTDYEKEIFKKVLDQDIKEIYEPVGCDECNHGYRGRIAIHEVLLINQTLRDAITKGVSKDILRNFVYNESGTDTMLKDGLQKVVDGKTSFDEILKLIDLEDDLGSNTQLGLQEQINASTMNFNPAMAQNIMYVPYPMAYDDDDDEERVVVRPPKKKKKVKVVEMPEVEDDDDEEEIVDLDNTPNDEALSKAIQKLADTVQNITKKKFNNNAHNNMEKVVNEYHNLIDNGYQLSDELHNDLNDIANSLVTYIQDNNDEEKANIATELIDNLNQEFNLDIVIPSKEDTELDTLIDDLDNLESQVNQETNDNANNEISPDELMNDDLDDLDMSFSLTDEDNPSTPEKTNDDLMDVFKDITEDAHKEEDKPVEDAINDTNENQEDTNDKPVEEDNNSNDMDFNLDINDEMLDSILADIDTLDEA